MRTYYVCGYIRNKGDGTIRKNSKRHVMSVAHSPDEAEKERRLLIAKHGTTYDFRIFDGTWKELEESKEE